LPRTVLLVELSEMTAMMPLAVALGIEISEASAEGVTGSLDHRPDLCTTAGVLHGGALMTLADTVGAVCAFLNLPAGARTSTLESKTNFLCAVTSGRVTAVCAPVHVGRSTIVLQTHVRDEADRLVSLTTQTQTVLVSS
jgi:1,4-dihydroxy-2-naphthoyl-CoA hydrolase